MLSAGGFEVVAVIGRGRVSSSLLKSFLLCSLLARGENMTEEKEKFYVAFSCPVCKDPAWESEHDSMEGARARADELIKQNRPVWGTCPKCKRAYRFRMNEGWPFVQIGG